MVVLSRWHPAPHGAERRVGAARPDLLRLLRPGDARACLGVAGNVAVEFALTLPVLMLLMLGSAEMARFVILHQKVDRVAVTMSDLVARAETIKESELDDIFEAADIVAQPFDLHNLGIVIVSAITNEDGSGARIAWQRSGDGAASHTSQIGTQDGAATLSADFEVREGETDHRRGLLRLRALPERADRPAPDAVSTGTSSSAPRHPRRDRSGLKRQAIRFRIPSPCPGSCTGWRRSRMAYYWGVGRRARMQGSRRLSPPWRRSAGHSRRYAAPVSARSAWRAWS